MNVEINAEDVRLDASGTGFNLWFDKVKQLGFTKIIVEMEMGKIPVIKMEKEILPRSRGFWE